MKLFRGFKHNIKILIIGGCIVFFAGLLVGGLGAYVENKYQNERKEIEQKLLDVESSGTIGKVIDSFSDDLGFLSKDITYERVSLIHRLLLKLDGQIHSFKKKYPRDKLKTDQFDTVSKQCEIIQHKLLVQKSVNKIFQSNPPAINGSTVQKDVIIEYNIDEKMIDSINVDSFEDDTWKQAIQDLLKEAKYQLKVISHAESVLNDCYYGDKVKENISKKEYEEITKLLNKVKRLADKVVLKERLKEIQRNIEVYN